MKKLEISKHDMSFIL